MRIPCVYCGERGNEEFVYLGDATVERPAVGHPDTSADQAVGEAAMQRWSDYVYLRDNPVGTHRELWHHIGGCRAWLVVTRNVSSHAILAVEAARTVASARASRTPAAGAPTPGAPAPATGPGDAR